jgi:hypothetical protein
MDTAGFVTKGTAWGLEYLLSRHLPSRSDPHWSSLQSTLRITNESQCKGRFIFISLYMYIYIAIIQFMYRGWRMEQFVSGSPQWNQCHLSYTHFVHGINILLQNCAAVPRFQRGGLDERSLRWSEPEEGRRQESAATASAHPGLLHHCRPLENANEFAIGSCHFFFGRLWDAVVRPPNKNLFLQSHVWD